MRIIHIIKIAGLACLLAGSLYSMQESAHDASDSYDRALYHNWLMSSCVTAGGPDEQWLVLYVKRGDLARARDLIEQKNNPINIFLKQLVYTSEGNSCYEYLADCAPRGSEMARYMHELFFNMFRARFGKHTDSKSSQTEE
jgi:hypothetical protein